jgi:hypothetical protein
MTLATFFLFFILIEILLIQPDMFMVKGIYNIYMAKGLLFYQPSKRAMV